ncbi:hypothetical protein B0J13DRAFT_423391, partial [Dactylonectria estremocensis]
PTGRRANYEALTVAYWEEEHIVREHIWTDTITLQRQLGFFPAPTSSDPTSSLTLSEYSLPLLTNPGEDVSADNKRQHQESESAFNNGHIDTESFRFSPNITVFTACEDGPDGLSLSQFLGLVQQLGSSFSNVNLSPHTTIAAGDWTASVSRISGTLSGTLRVPDYFSPVPIDPTGKSFEAWFSTIARWQDGQITYLKVMTDPVAILSQV